MRFFFVLAFVAATIIQLEAAKPVHVDHIHKRGMANDAAQHINANLDGGAGKRGVAYINAAMTNLFAGTGSKVTWAYNWAAQPKDGANPALKFVPMLWGTDSGMLDAWYGLANKALTNGADSFLAFNEPDLHGLSVSSGIDPLPAAHAYLEYIDAYSGYAKLGAPAITNSGPPGGITWLQQFLEACSGCQIDFIPCHWYGGADTTAFKNHITDVYNAGSQRPVWITEFAADGTEDQVLAFLGEVLPWMDAQPWIERYAYFWHDGNDHNPDGSPSKVAHMFGWS